MRQIKYIPPLCVTQDEVCGFAIFQAEQGDLVDYSQTCHCNLLGEEVYPDQPICGVQKSTALSAAINECAELQRRDKERLSKLCDLHMGNARLKTSHKQQMEKAGNDYRRSFNQLKAEMLVTLKALEQVAIAGVRNGDIALNHWVRDERMKHLRSIITNSFKDFSDRNIPSYDDEF